MHATATSIGCWMLVATGRLKLTNLGGKEQLILLAFSSLFTLNIAASNVSLYVRITDDGVFLKLTVFVERS